MTGEKHWQRGLAYLDRCMTSSGLLKRIDAQEKRIRKQKEAALERRRAARERGEAITGIDKFELKKLATQRRWDGRWDHRKMKMDAKRY